MALLLQLASQPCGGTATLLASLLSIFVEWLSSLRKVNLLTDGNAAPRHRDDAAVEDLARTCAQPGASDLQCRAVAMSERDCD